MKKDKKKEAEWGVWSLALITVSIGFLAYNYNLIGDRWTKVLEVVGSPFALGLGFYVFKKTDEMLNEKD